MSNLVISPAGRQYFMPKLIFVGLNDYARAHAPTGGFLKAVLSNDLGETVMRADPDSLQHIKDIVTYVYNDMPSACHGSPEAYKKWTEENSEHTD